MQLVKVAAAVLNQTPLDWQGNQTHILEAIAAARAERVSLLCLPELCITGYGCEDAFQAVGVQRTALDVLQEIVPQTGGLVVSLGLPLAHRQGLFNTAALVCDGRLLGFAAKRFLAGDGIHYEPRWFDPWPEGQQAVVQVAGTEYPLGDLLFECGEVRIGFEICEDAWVAQRPGSLLAQRGADVIFNPSASHFAFGKHEVRRRFVLEGSRAFNVSYVYSNLLGNEAGRAIYDGDAMIASAGQLLATGPRFSFAPWRVTSAVIDLDATRRRSGAARAMLSPGVSQASERVVRAEFSYPALNPVARPEPAARAWENGPHVKEEEFARAVSLGLFDYMRKSRSRGLVVSLSGGADSAAVATLAWVMMRLASGELGAKKLAERLDYWPELAGLIDSGTSAAEALQRWMPRLLTSVYQATRNSSTTTREAARGVATAVGATFIEFDVEPLVERYVAMVAQALGRELTWKHDDLALQNIQARVRSPGVWMLANLGTGLLVSTSNRSEAAVGYATMDGDTSGGLSPIAGIDKAFLRRWLVWMEREGPESLGPLAALAAVNVQAPTAELRPAASGQRDEDDLMPYELLDAVERAAIRDKLMPVEVFRQIRAEFADYSAAQLGTWVERFFRLWCRNQWKRERYAPSFHLDDENLDPKTWCRFPILSGGYERELAQLRREVAASSE